MRIPGLLRYSIFLGPFLVCSIVACGSNEREADREGTIGNASSDAPFGETKLQQMDFDVDPTLLGFVYEDTTLGLRFSPPRGWPPIEPDLLDRTRMALDERFPEGGRFHARPVRIFCEKDRRLFMIAGLFRDWPAPVNPLVEFADYKPLLERAMPDAEIRDGTYLRGKIVVYQLLITNPIMVNFRLILIREGRTPVQVDYLIPRGHYPDVVKAIEASIGSIETL